MEFVFPLMTFARLQTPTEDVFPAMLDTTWSTEFANSQLSIMPSLQISDAPNGIGPIRSASNAQKIGFSTLMEFVCPFLTNANLTIPMDCVLHASRDMIWLMELVYLELSTLPSPPIQDAANGTGRTRFALSALLNGPSMLIKSASLSLTFVLLMMPQELASRASKDTTWLTEFVSSQLSTLPSLLTQDVPSGIGTTKSALNAQLSGPSTLIPFASLSLTFAPLMTPMEPVFHASRDTISSTESANSPHSIMPSLQIMDVVNGTGTTKSALSVQLSGPSMLIKFAFK